MSVCMREGLGVCSFFFKCKEKYHCAVYCKKYHSMKTSITIILLALIFNNAFSHGLTLPYYTGFDNPAQRAGWVQYRTGFLSSYSLSNINNLSHDYNVGGSSNDTVVDWYVSPALNFTASAQISMKIFTGGFSNPIPDNCDIWFGTNNPNPTTGNFVLIGSLSYMQPKYVWLDTIINVPFTAASGYIAF